MTKKIYQFFMLAVVGLVVFLGTTMWTKAVGGTSQSGNNSSQSGNNSSQSGNNSSQPGNNTSQSGNNTVTPPTTIVLSAWVISSGNNMPGDVTKLYEINATNFPDEHFRNSISKDLDRNKDGYLSTKEVREAIGFNVEYNDADYLKIASMKGIEKFTNVNSIVLNNNHCLEYLDVSQNTRLMRLYVFNGTFDSLDLSSNSILSDLFIGGCSLNSLKLCQNGSLNTMFINKSDGLESLTIPDSVETAGCDDISTLKTLNLRNATKLTGLTCYSCNISTLDISKCTNLESLSIYDNPLTSLNVSRNTKLYSLNIQDTDIDAIDIRNCPDLISSYLSNHSPLYVDDDTAVIYQDAPVITDLYQEGSIVNVVFSIVPGAEGYALYRKTSAGVLEFVAHCDIVAGSTYFTYKQPVTNVGENYTYMVQCENYDLVPTSWMSKGKSIVEQTVINNPALNAVNNGSGIKLTWAKNEDTSKYRIYRAVGKGALVAIAKVGKNSYVDTNVTNGTEYTYEVRCLAANGNEIGKYDQKTITSSGFYPAPEINVSVEGSAIKVTWDLVDGIAKYRVMRKEEGGDWAALAKLTGTSYTDKNIESGKKYYYTLRLMNDSGEYVGAYDKNGTSITAPVIVAAPTVDLSNETAGIKVTWAAVDGISKYRVMRKVEGGDFVAYAKVSGTSYTDKNVEAGKTYTYTVRCLDNASKYVGTYDEVGKSLSRPAQLPAPVVTLTNTSEGVKVTWNAIDGAAKYRVLRRDVTGGFVALGKVSGTEYVDKTSESGNTYCYTVRCVDEAGKYIGAYNEEGVEIVCNKESQEQQINISAAESGANGITLIWQDPVADGVKIRVLRKVGDGGYEPIGKTSNMYYVDKNVEKGVTYTYTLRLIGADGKYFGTYDETGFTITHQ